MGRCSKGKPFGNRLPDSHKLKPCLCYHVAQNSRNNNAYYRNRHNSAGFLGNTHADGCRDGLWKQRNVVDMLQLKKKRHGKNAGGAGDDAGKDPEKHRGQILF